MFIVIFFGIDCDPGILEKIKDKFCRKRCQKGRLLRKILFALNILIDNLYGKYIFNYILGVFVYSIFIVKYFYCLIPKMAMTISFYTYQIRI